MNSMWGSSLLGIASTGVSILLGIVFIVVALTQVRRVSMSAALCFAGAGGLTAFGALVGRIVSLAVGFADGGLTLLTVSQVLTSLLRLVAMVLVPVGIFLLASAVKQPAEQMNYKPNQF